jgi:hypothetical protein
LRPRDRSTTPPAADTPRLDSPTPEPATTDRNLLFGVLALQTDLIDADQFAKGCALWAADKARPLADVLVAQGWLTPADRADVGKLLDRKLRKHGGDARASLAEVANDTVHRALAPIPDPARPRPARHHRPRLGVPRPLHPHPPPRHRRHRPGLAGVR